MERLPGYDSWLESPYQRAAAEGERAAEIIEDQDNLEGYLEWLRKDRVAEAFEEYCFENFWHELGQSFQELLHPAALTGDPEDPIGDNWPVWRLFLFAVLDRERMEVLVGSFIRSNRDQFEEWCLR